MKKLSILLVCCLLVGCSNKSEEFSTTSIEETTQPTTIIETTTETTVNEDMIRLESKVAELESKVSELESKLVETSVETTVEETIKETRPPKETVVVVVTATPTPTEPTQTESTSITTDFFETTLTASDFTYSMSKDGANVNNILRKAMEYVHYISSDGSGTAQPISGPGLTEQLNIGTYTIVWTCTEGLTCNQTVIITE